MDKLKPHARATRADVAALAVAKVLFTVSLILVALALGRPTKAATLYEYGTGSTVTSTQQTSTSTYYWYGYGPSNGSPGSHYNDTWLSAGAEAPWTVRVPLIGCTGGCATHGWGLSVYNSSQGAQPNAITTGSTVPATAVPNQWISASESTTTTNGVVYAVFVFDKDLPMAGAAFVDDAGNTQTANGNWTFRFVCKGNISTGVTREDGGCNGEGTTFFPPPYPKTTAVDGQSQLRGYSPGFSCCQSSLGTAVIRITDNRPLNPWIEPNTSLEILREDFESVTKQYQVKKYGIGGTYTMQFDLDGEVNGVPTEEYEYQCVASGTLVLVGSNFVGSKIPQDTDCFNGLTGFLGTMSVRAVITYADSTTAVASVRYTIVEEYTSGGGGGGESGEDFSSAYSMISCLVSYSCVASRGVGILYQPTEFSREFLDSSFAEYNGIFPFSAIASLNQGTFEASGATCTPWVFQGVTMPTYCSGMVSGHEWLSDDRVDGFRSVFKYFLNFGAAVMWMAVVFA